MTEAERIARANRAQNAYDEFMSPMFENLTEEYATRLAEVANTELSRDKRADKITALSNALKIVGTLKAGMLEIMRDGELARADALKKEHIEKMTAPQRRLFGIAPY